MTRKCSALDTFRLVAALLVVAIHISPLVSINHTADFILTRVIARAAVPFFFMTTGFFLFAGIKTRGRRSVETLIKKTARLYVLAMLIYLPLNIYNGYFGNSAQRLVFDLTLDGTFYHLWYLPAVMLGALIAYALYKKLGLRSAVFITAVLYLIGLGGDSYYGLTSRIPIVYNFYSTLFSFIRYTRNGLFFAPLFIVMGGVCRYSKLKIKRSMLLTGLIVSLMLMTAEGLLLRSCGVMRHDSMYLALVPCMYFLFSLLRDVDGEPARKRRSMATAVYIMHPWAIVAVWYMTVLAGFEYAMERYSFVFFTLSCAVSLAAAYAAVRLGGRFKQQNPGDTARAWVEVNLAALRHNVKALRECLPDSCELMAVVKADAYGHGAVRLAAELERCGVCAFAVAAVSEAVSLRRSGLLGELLVLGYTSPCESELLSRYRLTQLVVDGQYAKALASTGKRLRVHIAVDTGMHRLGINASDIDELESVFSHNNLTVTGIATHLASSDSLDKSDTDFTRLQIDRFFNAVTALREKGYDTGTLHIQASYGIINYPGLDCGYARAGIALYGVKSDNQETRTVPPLKPVLSIKSRVIQVREISPGESVSYGRLFTAEKPVKLATVSIGYADGVPRQLTGHGTGLVRSCKVPVVGRVCMDLLMLDVTGVEDVTPGDIVTLIGTDGMQEITCEDFAENCGTITNDILSRLGKRMPRVYIYKV